MWTSALALVPNVTVAAIGGSLNADAPSGDAVNATLFYDSDGGTRKRTDNAGGGSTTVDGGSWASDHPNHTQGAFTHVRLTHDTGINRATEAFESLGVWYAMSSNRQWPFEWAPGGIGPQGPDISTYDLDLSLDGGSTVFGTAIVTFNAEMESM